MATDIDTVMRGPSAPTPLSSAQPLLQSRTQQEIESHRNLKRPFGELEEGVNSETQPSEGRNVRLRGQAGQVLGNIGDIEKQAKNGPKLDVNLSVAAVPITQTPLHEEQGSNGDEVLDTRKGITPVPDNATNGSPLRPTTASAGKESIEGVENGHEDVEMENGVDRPNAEDHQSPRRAAIQSTVPTVNSDALNGPSDTPDASSQAHAQSSSTLAHALGHASASPSVTPLSSGENTHLSASNGFPHHSPSMESILKVAEAAVAAQNAANQAKLAAMPSTQTSSTTDPNLDPSLFSDTNNPQPQAGQGKNNDTSIDATKPSSPAERTTTPVATTTINAAASTSSITPTSSSIPSSSLSNNPYLSLSTNLLSRGTPGSTTPTNHPMFMPYPMFYPPAPVTPNSPTYPIPYNPYYYLAAPMPGPNGMYPPPANFPPPPPAQQQRPPAEQQRTKPKRLKAHTVTTKSFSIPMVPRDKKGKPMLPLNVGIMTVINLGEVCMREHFHTERYIFPVGYEVTRRYLSTVDPSVEVVYHCTILDGGDGPKFQIIPSDRPDKPIIAGTATGAWSNIVKQANAIRNRQHSNSVSGPDFFGLGQNTIKHLIQELPNADRLRDYVWQNFVEGGPLGGRHAAVIPALPEEYDASLPIGAYYPKRDMNSNPNLPRGMSHYPQHIIAQAEAQKLQRLAAQQQQQQQQQHQQQQHQQQQQQHQQQQQQQSQHQQPVAGPSGSSSAAATQLIPNSNPQHDPAAILTSELLNIQQYQPPQTPLQVPGPGQPSAPLSDRRPARSTGPGNSTSPSSTARQTRTRGNQQAGSLNVNGAEAVTPNADGTAPPTFASIMSAYPAPAIPSLPGQPTTTTS